VDARRAAVARHEEKSQAMGEKNTQQKESASTCIEKQKRIDVIKKRKDDWTCV
jgi:hypothetical protein